MALDGRRAYTLRGTDKDKLLLVLADDPDTAREAIAAVRPKFIHHHPSGWLARNVLEAKWSRAEARLGKAAMARELEPAALGPLVAALERGRPPGFVNWPAPFVLC
jgi:hypothetical protein